MEGVPLKAGFQNCLGANLHSVSDETSEGTDVSSVELSCMMHDGRAGQAVEIHDFTAKDLGNPYRYPAISRALGCATCAFGQVRRSTVSAQLIPKPTNTQF